MWYFYMIECIKMRGWDTGKKVVYTGETCRDPEIRFDEHVRGVHSNWMRINNYRPRRLIYVECMPDCFSKDDALFHEQQLKNNKELKKEMVAQ